MSEKKEMFDLYRIEEREQKGDFWHKVGYAIRNRDGSLSVFLPLLDAKLQLRKRLPPKEDQ